MDLLNWLRAERDRVIGWSLVALGGVMILVTWFATSDTALVSDQIPYVVSGGLGGLFFLGVGVALLLRADLHDEWRKLDRIEAVLKGGALPDVGDSLAARDTEATSESLSPGETVSANRTGHALTSALTLPPNVAAVLQPDATVALRAEMGPLVVAVGAALLIGTSWLQVSGTRNVGAAFDDAGLGVLGVVLCGVAVAWHFVRLRAATYRRRAAVVEPLLGLEEASRSDRSSRVRDGFWVVRGSRRYHQGDCPVLAGQPDDAVSALTASDGLSPCRLCGADEVKTS